MKVKDLNNRVVLVAGADNGIGRDTALLDNRRGATFVLCDRNEADAFTDAVQARPGCSAERAVDILRMVGDNRVIAPMRPDSRLRFPVNLLAPAGAHWIAVRTAGMFG